MNHQPPPISAVPSSISSSADAPAIDIRRYLGIIRKRAWIIAAVVALGITTAVVYTKRKPKIYRATASVVIDPTPPQVFGSQIQEVIQLGAGSYWSNQEYYNTQLQVIAKFDLARRTVEDERNAALTAKLLELEPAHMSSGITKEQVQEAADLFRVMIKATQTRESRIVNIHVEHSDPELAIALANAHARSYYEYSKGVRGEDSKEASEILLRELQSAEQKLRESEQKLLKFKEDNDLLSVSLEDKQNILAADIARYTAALSDSRIKRIELTSVRARAQSLKGEDVLESPLFALTSSSTIFDSMKDQYLREKQRLGELAQDLGPRHPEYQSQQQKVDQQLEALKAEARLALRELDERYQAFLASEQQFQAEVERLKAEAFEIGPKTVEYNQLMREHQSDEENYRMILSRLSASELTRRNTTTNVSIHTEAREADLVYPRLSLNLAIAGMFSLMVGLAVAFLLDFLDRTIKSPDVVERAVGAPLLGMIPVVEDIEDNDDRATQRERDLYVFHNQASSVAEHCRSIRTNILFSSANRPMKTLTISSPQPREGKTTTTIYLGTIMAQSKQRVLLVDTDMRRPRLHFTLLDKEISRGLSNLLLPDTDIEAELDSIVQESDIPNLFVLPCGPRPPNPAELLLTDKFKEVLAALEKRFDRILLDSPPLLLMNDGVVLSRLCDGVVMVAQSGKTSIDEVMRSAKMIRDVNAPILGMILNNMDIASREYGNYYRYGYGYYNYGEKSSKKDEAAA